MRAAAVCGVDIPKLCATDRLDPFGSCRLCLVEIDGRKGTPASCTTPVAPGMQVTTQSPKLEQLRRGVMELYISDHPLDCLTCAANGDCELQDMSGAVGLREVRYGYEGENHLDLGKDTSNPYFTFDSSKCIVCSRCVRACEEVQGTFALTIEGRGFGSRVAAGFKGSFFDSDCVSCGACVQVCPTATLTENTVIEMGQPRRTVLTTCAYCGVGCSFKAEMQGEQVVRMVPVQGRRRQRGPLVREGPLRVGLRHAPGPAAAADDPRDDHDEWQRRVVGRGHRATPPPSCRTSRPATGRAAIGGITSSRCTNEEVFAVQKMVRTAFGNNNVDTCARVCHSPTGFGLSQAFGTSAGTQDFKSVEPADVILLIGANPTDAHPVFASRMKKRLREGAELIVVDPRRIDLVRTRARRGRAPPAAAPGHQRRRHQRARPRGRHRGPRRPPLRAASAAIPPSSPTWAAFVVAAREQPRGDGGAHRRARRRGARAPPACTPRPATAPSTTASASPSTARAPRW